MAGKISSRVSPSVANIRQHSALGGVQHVVPNYYLSYRQLYVPSTQRLRDQPDVLEAKQDTHSHSAQHAAGSAALERLAPTPPRSAAKAAVLSSQVLVLLRGAHSTRRAARWRRGRWWAGGNRVDAASSKAELSRLASGFQLLRTDCRRSHGTLRRQCLRHEDSAVVLTHQCQTPASAAWPIGGPSATCSVGHVVRRPRAAPHEVLERPQASGRPQADSASGCGSPHRHT